MAEIKKEKAQYVDLPKIYAFKDARQKEVMLNRIFARVNREIDEMIKNCSTLSKLSKVIQKVYC
jgi:hypothetical protein